MRPCVCGCVAGRGGETLKLITRTTGARVSCSKEKMQGPGGKGNVTIRGTRQELEQAKVRSNSSNLITLAWSIFMFRST